MLRRFFVFIPLNVRRHMYTEVSNTIVILICLYDPTWYDRKLFISKLQLPGNYSINLNNRPKNDLNIIKIMENMMQSSTAASQLCIGLAIFVGTAGALLSLVLAALIYQKKV